MSHTLYDDTLKMMADLDPEAFLRMCGALSPNRPAHVAVAPRHLPKPARLPDLLYEVRSGEGAWIVHIEAQTRDEPAMDDREVEYAVLAWVALRKEVRSTLVVLTPRGGTRAARCRAVVRAGGLQVTLRYRVMHLWRIRATQALALGHVSLLPFVPLMRGTKRHMRAALKRLGAMSDEPLRRELACRFVLLGGLRYNHKDLFALVEELAMLTLEDLRESSFYQFAFGEGEAKGEARGEVRLLRRLLERRFGRLPGWAVRRINKADRATVEAWGDRVLDANGMHLEDLLT